MKQKNLNIFTAIAFGAVMAFTACSKNDGPITNRVNIEDVPAITTNTKTGGTTGTITFTNQAAFLGEFKVSLYFDGALPPSKVDVVVRKNASTANVKVFKADVTTLPSELTVTAAQIVALFGDTLKLNDTYDFAPDIYVNNKKYEAFPSVGNGLGQGITGMSSIGYGAFVRYSVK